MAYSLLAHLYPRIKGSQEDIATYSLGYLFEQSSLLNETFTNMVAKKLEIESFGKMSYRCQDADSEYGRPDIAAYQDGQLRLLCEAKFYAGLTENQPVSYIKRLYDIQGSGLIIICPRKRVISLWDSLKSTAYIAGLQETPIKDYLVSYGLTRMSIISWEEILAELIFATTEREPERLGDIKQLKGFCEKIDSESFVPFRPEDFGAQIARDIDRYYQVVDEIHKVLLTKKELDPTTKGLRKAPRWQGYSQYIRIKNFGVSIDYVRMLWKSPSSIETPFWFCIQEIVDSKWVFTKRLSSFYESIEARKRDDFYGSPRIALIPKPYLTLEELAEDMAQQIIDAINRAEAAFEQ